MKKQIFKKALVLVIALVICCCSATSVFAKTDKHFSGFGSYNYTFTKTGDSGKLCLYLDNSAKDKGTNYLTVDFTSGWTATYNIYMYSSNGKLLYSKTNFIELIGTSKTWSIGDDVSSVDIVLVAGGGNLNPFANIKNYSAPVKITWQK